MKRILIAELKQETATFNPFPTTYDDFRIIRGGQILSAYRGTRTELGGIIDQLGQEGEVELIPTVAAAAVSGGPIVTADLDRLLGEIIETVGKHRTADGALLVLHGAMAGEEEVDPEGRLLSEVRRLLGAAPIVATLDLHAVLTDRMLTAADVLVPFHTYPHVDQFETGQRAVGALLRLINGAVTPETFRIKLPMLVRGDELITATGRFGEAIRMCQKMEAAPGVLTAGVIIGNAFTDVPDLQSNVLVTTEGNPSGARQSALEVARFMWENRERFQSQLVSLSEAIRLAQATPGLTVFSDAADATASGAAGDSNTILRGLLDHGYAGRALAPIVDAPAVQAAQRAGKGATIQIPLGGTRDPGRFQPLVLSARVKSLHDGEFLYEDGTAAKAGRTAVLEVGNITLLVTERSVYVVGQKVFQSHGLEPAEFDLVVVKSPNGFRPWYEPIAARIVPVDVPGSTSANLRSLPYRRCVRPIWPLDNDARPDFDV